MPALSVPGREDYILGEYAGASVATLRARNILEGTCWHATPTHRCQKQSTVKAARAPSQQRETRFVFYDPLFHTSDSRKEKGVGRRRKIGFDSLPRSAAPADTHQIFDRRDKRCGREKMAPSLTLADRTRRPSDGRTLGREPTIVSATTLCRESRSCVL
ncbi:hypothetical protein MRX96_054477 [Rhipicephalus microplus]